MTNWRQAGANTIVLYIVLRGPTGSNIIHFKVSFVYKEGLLYSCPYVFLDKKELALGPFLFLSTTEIRMFSDFPANATTGEYS